MGFEKIANPALTVTADRKIKLVEAPVLQPGPGEVLVHVKATGVCGSDIHFWKDGGIGPLEVKGDCILGHEAAGVVVECGEGVANFAIGDRVALEPGVPCGECFLCRDGRYNLCEDVNFIGVYPYNGSLQRLKKHPAKWIHRIPDNMTFSQGALLEPLSVVIHGLEEAGLTLGRGALVCGAGPIGLIALAAARASGAHPLVITDLAPGRLEFAKSLVPHCQTYLVEKHLSAEENAERIRAMFGTRSSVDGHPDFESEYLAPNSVIECTGFESSVCTAAFSARRGGIVTVIGVGKSTMDNLPFMHLSLAEIQLKFINRYHDTWPRAINLLSGGILNLDKLVTHTFPLEKAVDGLTLASDVSKGSIKVHIIDEQEINP
ncbi:MAG: hypothetical protein Q9227_007582 [Pyrenula ochraceoflavens]